MSHEMEQPSPIRLALPSRQGLSGLFDYTLFVGPSACFHHSQDVVFDPARTSALCLDDTQLALGTTEQAIERAAEELLASVRPPIGALRILTSCQSAFVGADFRAAARRIARRHGIVCVHEENSRMTVAGKRDKGVVSATGDPEAFAAGLLDCAGAGAPGEDGGADEGAEGRLVFMSDALSIDARCELLHACRDLGFSRIQTLGDWNTPAGLARGARARFALVASAGCVPLARAAQERWGLAWEFLPVSYALEEIDAQYRRLGDLLGARVDTAPWHDRAQAAIDRALRAANGRELVLDLAGAGRPWHLAKALLDYGFRIRRIGCSYADRAHPIAFDADYDALIAAYPHVEGTIAHEEFFHRKDKLVRRDAADRHASGEPGAASVPEEGACWGYFALQQCMERIAAALAGEEPAAEGGDTEGKGALVQRRARSNEASDSRLGPASACAHPAPHASGCKGDLANEGACTGRAPCKGGSSAGAARESRRGNAGRKPVKGLFSDLMPFVPDVVGACAAFSETAALVLFNDMNGTLSTFYQRVGLPEESPLTLRSTKNVRELSYVLGRDEDFMAAYRDQATRAVAEVQAETLQPGDVCAAGPEARTASPATRDGARTDARGGLARGIGGAPLPPFRRGASGLPFGRDTTPAPACAPPLEGVFELVVLLHGPVSATTGVDIARLARRLEGEVRVPVLAVEGTGSGPYDQGVSDALLAVFRRVQKRLANKGAPRPASRPDGVNLLGINPLDLPGRTAREAYGRLLCSAAGGAQVLSRWGTGGGWEQWERAAGARLNIVATASGLALAREMERTWGTPFVCADELSLRWDALGVPAAGLARPGQRILIVGEQLQANLLRRALSGTGVSDTARAEVRVAWFFGMERDRMREGDVRLNSEGDLAALAREGRFDAVFADPALSACLPAGTPLFPLRNLAVADGPASGTPRAQRLRDLAARGDAAPWREAETARPEPTPWTPAWLHAIGEFLRG